LLGAFISIHSTQPDPAFINNESSHSLIYATDTDYNYSTSIKETRDGVTRTISPANLPARYLGTAVPLYVGYK
jgi:hypothetical protein